MLYMDIYFKTRKLQKLFNSERELKKEFGEKHARKIMRRLAVLHAAPTLAHVPHQPPDRRHELIGKDKGTYAVDTEQPYRLIFEPNHDPMPTKDDGGIDISKVTSVTILKVEDYH